MRRREFIAALGMAAAAPLAARAQQHPLPIIGVLHPTAPEAWDAKGPFLAGLAEQGYVDGRNVAIEYVWAHNEFGRLPELALDLARHNVTVMVACAGTAVARAAASASKTTPIVFLVGSNPVDAGLVASLPRPGGNSTGATILTNELIGKRVEVLHAMAPSATRLGLLVSVGNPVGDVEIKLARQATEALGLDLIALSAGNPGNIETAFATLLRQQVGALVVSSDAFFYEQRNQVFALAAHHGVPTIYGDRAYVVGGGLVSVGANFDEGYRLVGIYTGRILKGDRPADLPVQQATKISLAINLRTAQALGLTIPETLLATADEVIQ